MNMNSMNSMSARHHHPSDGPATHGDVAFNGAKLIETQYLQTKQHANVMDKSFSWMDPAVATVLSTVDAMTALQSKTGGENDYLHSCARWWAFVCAQQTGFEITDSGFQTNFIDRNEQICSAPETRRFPSDAPLLT